MSTKKSNNAAVEQAPAQIEGVNVEVVSESQMPTLEERLRAAEASVYALGEAMDMLLAERQERIEKERAKALAAKKELSPEKRAQLNEASKNKKRLATANSKGFRTYEDMIEAKSKGYLLGEPYYTSLGAPLEQPA